MTDPDTHPITAELAQQAYDRHMADSAFDGEILWPGHAVAGEVDAAVESIAKFVRDYPHAATAYVLVDVVEDGIDLHYVAKTDAAAVAQMGGGTVQDAMNAFLKEGDRLPKLREGGRELAPRSVIRTTDRSRPRKGARPDPRGFRLPAWPGSALPRRRASPAATIPASAAAARSSSTAAEADVIFTRISRPPAVHPRHASPGVLACAWILARTVAGSHWQMGNGQNYILEARI